MWKVLESFRVFLHEVHSAVFFFSLASHVAPGYDILEKSAIWSLFQVFFLLGVEGLSILARTSGSPGPLSRTLLLSAQEPGDLTP